MDHVSLLSMRSSKCGGKLPASCSSILVNKSQFRTNTRCTIGYSLRAASTDGAVRRLHWLLLYHHRFFNISTVSVCLLRTLSKKFQLHHIAKAFSIYRKIPKVALLPTGGGGGGVGPRHQTASQNSRTLSPRVSKISDFSLCLLDTLWRYFR